MGNRMMRMIEHIEILKRWNKVFEEIDAMKEPKEPTIKFLELDLEITLDGRKVYPAFDYMRIKLPSASYGETINFALTKMAGEIHKEKDSQKIIEEAKQQLIKEGWVKK